MQAAQGRTSLVSNTADDPILHERLDHKVPPGMMRITQHYHNLIYIRYFYESIGQQPPEWVKKEMTRVDKVLQQEIDREYQQGGLLRENA